MINFSIVIPCHNEAENLPALVSEIRGAMNRTDIEVVLVNDGSSDNTATVLKELTKHNSFIKVVTNITNQGYGGAILEGLMTAQGTYLGWMHGDLQTPFKNVLEAVVMIEALDDPEDIYIKGKRKGRSLVDQFFTFGMSLFETCLFGKVIYDINAQPNIFHRNFFATWKNPPRDFSLDLYAYVLARRHKLMVVRIPVTFPPRQHGFSHWNFGMRSKLKFIKRTINYSFRLKDEL